MKKSVKSVKSVNSRLEYARRHNESAAAALLLINKEKAAPKEEDTPLVNALPTEGGERGQNADSHEYASCICSREPATLRCTKCAMFTYGRVMDHCPSHKNTSFLMDFIYCPNCMAPKECLQGIELNSRGYLELNAHMMQALRGIGSNHAETKN